MLHHWLAAQEGFNIKLGNVLTIDFNSQNATKLKLESKCGENFSENKFSKFWQNFQGNENIVTKHSLFIFMFCNLVKFDTKTK
jgi:hypothetical protein